MGKSGGREGICGKVRKSMEKDVGRCEERGGGAEKC